MPLFFVFDYVFYYWLSYSVSRINLAVDGDRWYCVLITSCVAWKRVVVDSA